jgi:hypothetical protein
MQNLTNAQIICAFWRQSADAAGSANMPCCDRLSVALRQAIAVLEPAIYKEMFPMTEKAEFGAVSGEVETPK